MPIAVGEISLFYEGARGSNRVPTLEGEAKFIREARNGDVRAFNELVRAHQERVYRLAYRILGDAEAASDATQEAFISAYRHIGAFRGGSLHAWLMRIVTNACYDQLRMKQRQRSSSLEALAADPEKPTAWLERAAPESPQDILEKRELNDLIQRGLARLPFDQRVAVVLADAENHSYEQISEITGTNIGTVKSRLARGRNSLREYLLADQDLLPREYRRDTAAINLGAL